MHVRIASCSCDQLRLHFLMFHTYSICIGLHVGTSSDQWLTSTQFSWTSIASPPRNWSLSPSGVRAEFRITERPTCSCPFTAWQQHSLLWHVCLSCFDIVSQRRKLKWLNLHWPIAPSRSAVFLPSDNDANVVMHQHRKYQPLLASHSTGHFVVHCFQQGGEHWREIGWNIGGPLPFLFYPLRSLLSHSILFPWKSSYWVV